MACFVLTTLAASGHVGPFTSVAAELVRRGHQVVWYCDETFREPIERSGARLAGPTVGTFPLVDGLDEQYPELAGMAGPARAGWFIENVFAAPVAGQYRDLSALVADEAADAVIADSTSLAAGILHEVEGTLWATLSIAPLAIPDPDVPPFGPGLPPPANAMARKRLQMMAKVGQATVLRGATKRINAERATLGLKPQEGVFDNNATPFLYMQATAPSFEYPRRDKLSHLHFVGPLLPAPATAPPALPQWWEDLRGSGPVVLVTQGTLDTNPGDLIVPAVRALADTEATVVVTGAVDLPRLIDPLPANVRFAPFLPYDQLMPLVGVAVSNGGYGTVQLALSHGVPLVVAGATDDKPEVCARVAWSGAGINLATNKPSPKKIKQAVEQVLRDERYRAAAGRIQRDFAAHDAPKEIAGLVERLVATRRAVVDVAS